MNHMNGGITVLPIHTCTKQPAGFRQHRLRIFEGGILTQVWQSNRGWRKWHVEELHNLYCSPECFEVVKWSRIRWVGCVERMVLCEIHAQSSWQTLLIREWMILNWILNTVYESRDELLDFGQGLGVCFLIWIM
jgi:hypothetical protein